VNTATSHPLLKPTVCFSVLRHLLPLLLLLTTMMAVVSLDVDLVVVGVVVVPMCQSRVDTRGGRVEKSLLPLHFDTQPFPNPCRI
jgi:hypothetical protein